MKKLFIILISILASVSFVEAAGSLLAPQSNGLLTPQIINLASMVTGTLTTSNGGTGTTTPYGILYGDGSSTLKSTIIGTGLSFFNGVLTNTNNINNVATSSAETSTYIPFWTSTNGTPALLSGGTSNLTWDGSKLNTSNLNVTGYATTTSLCLGGVCHTDWTQMTGSQITMYKWNQSMTDIATYESLYSFPQANGTEIDESCATGGIDTYCTIDNYVSTSTDRTFTGFPAGVWDKWGWGYSSGAGAQIEITLIKRTSAGVETVFGQGTSTPLTTTNSQYHISVTLGAQTWNSNGTDRLVTRYKIWNPSGSAKTGHTVYGSSAHAGYLITPATVANLGYATTIGNNAFLGTNSFINTTTSGVATTSALAITGLTGLMYANDGTKPISNPTNLTWDNTLYRLGIGTTTPYAKLSIWGSGNTTNQVFEAVDNASTTLMNILGNGNVNIGGSNLTYNGTTGVTAISSAYIGTQYFDNDIGLVNWIDAPVTSSTALGGVTAYTASMDSNPMLTIYSESLGDGSVWHRNIGFGTTTPSANFHFASATSTASTYPLFRITDINNNSFFSVKQDGKIGMGTTSPATTLDVNGSISQVTVKSCSLGVITDAYGTLSGCVASDKSLKKNIQPLTSDISAFLGLKPVNYEWKDSSRGKGTKSGFIAQDTKSVFPSAVVSASPTLLAVDPNAISALTVKTLQDLYKQVQTQQKTIDNLQKRLDKLEAIIKLNK